MSRNSSSLMQVFALPIPLSYIDSNLREAPFQRLAFAPLSTRGRIFESKFLQVLTNQSGQCGVTLHRNLPHVLDQFVVEGEGNIHVHRTRETLISASHAQNLKH